MRKVVFLFVVCGCLSAVARAQPRNVAARINSRDYPSVFQAWNPIEMPGKYPLNTPDGRLKALAKHDVYWEEPISQLGMKVDLALGAIWDAKFPGLATKFTRASLRRALENRRKLLSMNPHLVFLLEVRWRDAPGSFLPADSPFWKRNADGSRAAGWDGGPEPYYLLDPESAAWRENIARQARIAVESGLYDGIMLDWNGTLPVVKRVRESIGERAIIVVNIHDDIVDGMKYKDLINGSFMEMNPESPDAASDFSSARTTWEQARKALLWFEANFRKPTVNCFEVWGARRDERRMRAATTLTLTHSNGSVLYADPNPLKTPDHLHDWYSFWDFPLGKPKGRMTANADGSFTRAFTGGTVIYNPHGNKSVTVTFQKEMRRASNGATGRTFVIQERDGDIFASPQTKLKIETAAQNNLVDPTGHRAAARRLTNRKITGGAN